MATDDEIRRVDKQYPDEQVRYVRVPLTKSEQTVLWLKMKAGETEADAVRRIIAESLDHDALERALSKFMDVLERLIVMQKKLNFLGVESDDVAEESIKDLTASFASVSSLKKKLEKGWRSS